MFTSIKTSQEIDSMRESGRILATTLDFLKSQTKVGMSTKQIAALAATELKRLGGKPAFLGYQGFPDIICISVNNEVVHGIPRPDKILKSGDIVSLDFGVDVNGMITDSAISFIIGTGTKQAEKLVAVTEQSLLAAVDVLRDGVRTGDIGAAVEKNLSKNNYGIVRDLVGHGVGHHLHEDPNVPNYGLAGTGSKLSAGMTIAIEPMATLGSHRVVLADDGWTVLTEDGSLSAHFEHTVLITRDGAEILTSI